MITAPYPSFPNYYTAVSPSHLPAFIPPYPPHLLATISYRLLTTISRPSYLLPTPFAGCPTALPPSSAGHDIIPSAHPHLPVIMTASHLVPPPTPHLPATIYYRLSTPIPRLSYRIPTWKPLCRQLRSALSCLMCAQSATVRLPFWRLTTSSGGSFSPIVANSCRNVRRCCFFVSRLSC